MVANSVSPVFPGQTQGLGEVPICVTHKSLEQGDMVIPCTLYAENMNAVKSDIALLDLPWVRRALVNLKADLSRFPERSR